jgi:hypothetical protein
LNLDSEVEAFNPGGHARQAKKINSSTESGRRLCLCRERRRDAQWRFKKALMNRGFSRMLTDESAQIRENPRFAICF